MQSIREKATLITRLLALTCSTFTLSMGLPVLAQPSAGEILGSSLQSINPQEYLKNAHIGYIATICAIADGQGLNAKTISLLSKPLPSSKFPRDLRGNKVDSSVLPYLREFPANCNIITNDSSFKRLVREVSGRVSSKHQLASFYFYGTGVMAAACVVDRHKGVNILVPSFYKLLTRSASKYLSAENSRAAVYGFKYFADSESVNCRNYSSF